MTAFCPDCLVIEVSPTARDGRCDWCRPSRSHSTPKRTRARDAADKAFNRLLEQHPNQ